MNNLDDFKLQELKDLHSKFNKIGHAQKDKELKTKYLVIASNLTALLIRLEVEKNGRYE
jgi:hypothetical protein